jgi:hypothetical protein
MHRFVWDLRYPPPKAVEHDYPIAAIYKDTPREPRGPYVLPGQYTVRLSAGGETDSQPLTVVMDPRVKTPAAALEQQLELAMKLSGMMSESFVRSQAGSKSKEWNALNRDLAHVLDVIEGSDNTPTSQGVAAVAELENRLSQLK